MVLGGRSPNSLPSGTGMLTSPMVTGIRLYPCGYPVDIQSPAAQVMDAASALWGEWPQLFDDAAISLDIEVTNDRVSGALEEPSMHSAGDRLEFHSRQGVACFSRDTRSGHLRIARSALDDPAWFGYFWLRSLVLTSLDMVFFEPLHAAGVARDQYGMKSVEVRVKGPGSGRESAVRALAAAGLHIVVIRDVTPIPHNGCRPPKRRRV